MSKDVWNKAKLKRYLQEGRGSGRLEGYKSWLTMHDVSSKGRSTRLYSHKLQRTVNLFSDLQTYCFHMLEFDDAVLDIREQFPLLGLKVNTIELDKELSKKIFSEKHEIPQILTTTFLINKVVNGNEKEIALYVKYAKDLEQRSTIQRAEILRRYFQQVNIDFYVVTENDINQTIAKTIASILKTYDLEVDYPTLPFYVPMVKNEFVRLINMKQEPLKMIFKRIDTQYALQTGSTAIIFKHLIAHKEIAVADLSALDFGKSMEELGVRFLKGVN